MQNKKIDKEINEVNKYIYLITDSLRGVRFYVAKLVLLPEIIVFLIYLSFLLILVYVSVPFSIIVSFFLVISFLRNMINDFVWFCADFSRKIATIEKLWDFFDNTPEIK
ncbi:MAG: hypothetical protein LBU14_02025 [Candidatus Peribacteria bacterium]|nr:hypothetical protein [Candidatus Peribacteria bacterium]